MLEGSLLEPGSQLMSPPSAHAAKRRPRVYEQGRSLGGDNQDMHRSVLHVINRRNKEKKTKASHLKKKKKHPLSPSLGKFTKKGYHA